MAAYATPGPAGIRSPGVALLWEPATAADRETLLAGLKFFIDQLPRNSVELTTHGPTIGLLINRRCGRSPRRRGGRGQPGRGRRPAAEREARLFKMR